MKTTVFKNLVLIIYVSQLLRLFYGNSPSILNSFGILPPETYYQQTIYNLDNNFDLQIGKKLPFNYCWKRTSFVKVIDNCSFAVIKVFWNYHNYYVGFNRWRRICYIEIDESVSLQPYDILNYNEHFCTTDGYSFNLKYEDAERQLKKINSTQFFTESKWIISYGNSEKKSFPLSFSKYDCKYMDKIRFTVFLNIFNLILIKALIISFIPCFIIFLLNLLNLDHLFEVKFFWLKKAKLLFSLLLFVFDVLLVLHLTLSEYLYGYVLFY